jgi:hypothetical protein
MSQEVTGTTAQRSERGLLLLVGDRRPPRRRRHVADLTAFLMTAFLV